LGFDAGMMRALAIIFAMLPGLAQAEGVDHEDYVASNILAIFYHEMGHALIDIMGLPIFGQEEDAADVLSILMIHDFFDEENAVQMAYDTADNFLADAERSDEVAYWDTHGPDLQRYYTTVCLFVGGNFDERVDIAEDLGLPEERLDWCAEEFDLAYASWGPVLDEITVKGGGQTLVLSDDVPDSPDAKWLYGVMKSEVDSLNAEFKLPVDIAVRVEDCDEPNAYYDGEEKAIIMCTEFVDHLENNLPN
jgi:hypothetical protein